MASVDFAYLASYAAGDRQVIVEVLGLFQGQAELWAEQLADPGQDRRDLAHTVKGAARGIGATALGDVADLVEQGAADQVPALKAALDEVLGDIAAYLGGPQGTSTASV